MENTFTYTARSALFPEKVVTFTLYDHHVSVAVGAPLEQVERALTGAEGEEAEAEAEVEETAQPAYALKPMGVSLLQKGTHPFSVADVDAQAGDGGLAVTTWVRAKGLRLMPLRFAWDEVDNPEGAERFAQEVRARKRGASYPGRFAGVMDYWASWLLLGGLVMALFWPRKRQEEEDEG